TQGAQTVATGTGADFAFTPGREGLYSATLAVTDTTNGRSAVATTTVTANDVVPTVAPIANQTVNEGTPVTLTGSYSQPGTTDAQVLSWHVVSSNGQVIPDGSGATFSFTPADNG